MEQEEEKRTEHTSEGEMGGGTRPVEAEQCQPEGEEEAAAGSQEEGQGGEEARDIQVPGQGGEGGATGLREDYVRYRNHCCDTVQNSNVCFDFIYSWLYYVKSISEWVGTPYGDKDKKNKKAK